MLQIGRFLGRWPSPREPSCSSSGSAVKLLVTEAHHPVAKQTLSCTRLSDLKSGAQAIPNCFCRCFVQVCRNTVSQPPKSTLVTVVRVVESRFLHLVASSATSQALRSQARSSL